MHGCRLLLGTSIACLCVLRPSLSAEQEVEVLSKPALLLPGRDRATATGRGVVAAEPNGTRLEKQRVADQMGSEIIKQRKVAQLEELVSANDSTANGDGLQVGKKFVLSGGYRQGVSPVEIHVGTVLLMTVLMAGAAGFGAVPFFFVGSLSKEWAALANAVACGVMLACSFDLMHEGQPYGGGLVVLGILAGALFISASQQWLERFEDVRFQGLQGINARKILLMIGIMAAHAFGEGAGVGVSFCGSRGWAQGVLVTLAIGLHNIPEGLAVSTVLVARGIAPKHALLWTLFTSMPQPLVAVPSFLFVDTFRTLLPVALGFAAGCMLWMVFAELLPDALADAAHGKVATVGTFSAAWLEGLRMMLATLEGGNGHLSMPDTITSSTVIAGASLILPAAVSGGLGGKLSGLLAKDGAATIGLAAGILAWQGGSALTYNLAFGPRKDLLLNSLTAAAGVVGTVLIWKLHSSLWAPGLKLKQEDGPGKPLGGQVVIAAEQNGVNGHHLNPEDSLSELAGPHPAEEPDLEMAGVKRRVFAPYQQPHKQLQRGVLMAGLAAGVVFSLGEGFRIAQLSSLHSTSVLLSWPTVAFRSLLPGIAATALLQSCCSPAWRPLCAGLLAAVVPFVAFVEGFRVATLPDSAREGRTGANMAIVAASAVALTIGLWVMRSASRQLNRKQGTKGLLKGLGIAASVSLVSTLLCWQTPFCIDWP